METLDRSNFKPEHHAQYQGMFDRVNNSTAICHVTMAPSVTVQDYLYDITTQLELHQPCTVSHYWTPLTFNTATHMYYKYTHVHPSGIPYG